MKFLNSLKKRSNYYSSPFNHWDLNEPLTEETINEICKTEIVDLTQMNLKYDGTRAIDDGEVQHVVDERRSTCISTPWRADLQ